MNQGQMIQLVALVAVLLLFIVPGFLYYTRGITKAALLRNIVLWLALALVIAVLYKIFGGA